MAGLTPEDDLLVVAADTGVDRHCLCVEQDRALGALLKDAVFFEEVQCTVKCAASFFATVLALLFLKRGVSVSASEDLTPRDSREVYRHFSRVIDRNGAIVD